MTQTQPRTTVAISPAGESLEVRFRSGESYEVTVRWHGFTVDQPSDLGGEDLAPTPTELFVASLATCVAFYAGRFLTRHGHGRDGLGVSVTYRMASDRPARVTDIGLTVRVPEDLPVDRWPALHAVVSHCTVHNSLVTPPTVRIDVTAGAP
jgi:putative redox protein